jgi:lysophospholipase L1-like esterase
MAPSEVIGVHAAADPQGLQGKVYVALGDSISAGRYATTQPNTFPFLIAGRLGMRLDLVAVSGTTAAWGAQQISAVRAARPALVTIELGTNDVGYRTPVDTFSAEYEAIVAGVSAANRQVLCLSSWLPSTAIDQVIEATCERHGGTFVSLSGYYEVNSFHAQNGGQSYLGRADWFHPGDQGHAAIAAAALFALGAGPAPVLPGAIPATAGTALQKYRY